MWEYTREETSTGSYKPEQFMQLLNNYGKEGWEIVHYWEQEVYKDSYKFIVIMKRQRT